MTDTNASATSTGARVATLFLAFGLFAGAVVVLGLVLALVEGTAQQAFAWATPAAFARDLGALSARGVLALGLLLLLLLPIVRNTALAVVLLRRKQPRAALLAVVVIVTLLALYAYLTVHELVRSAP